ncbi:MAG: hypothetical protein M1818_000441 [Claussenomyces sp. TS43310]|nr:MAG: hypothetical protein M1818_000441 [Claussenomyces sp. TS43310]
MKPVVAMEFQTATPEATYNLYHLENNPKGVISIALSENFNIDDVPLTTYSGSKVGGLRFREAMAGHVNKYFNPSLPVCVDDVLCANGVTAICSISSFALADEGEGLLLMRLIYGKFENDWSILSQMKMLYVESGDINPFSPDVVIAYAARIAQAEAAGTPVKAMLICNPHNPSGLCYSTETLLAIARLCASHNIHLISDKIYALLVFPAPSSVPFTSMLSIDVTDIIDPSSVYVLYGISKDFCVPRLHLGALVTRNTQLQSALQAIGLVHALSGVACHVGSLMLEDTNFVGRVTALSRRNLSENYAMVTHMFDEADISYWRGGCAGFFLWVNLSALLEGDGGAGEDKLVQRFQEGLWLNPGAERGEYRGWVRVIISHEKGKLEEGIRR